MSAVQVLERENTLHVKTVELQIDTPSTSKLQTVEMNTPSSQPHIAGLNLVLHCQAMALGEQN